MTATLMTSVSDNNGFRLLIRILISRDSHVLNKNTAAIPLLLFD